MNTKKFPIAVQRKVDAINSMIDEINQADAVPYTYAGGTYPYAVYIKPIVIKNQFVTIETEKLGTYIDGKERYNVNKVSVYGDEYCKKHLMYSVNIIHKTFKSTINK